MNRWRDKLGEILRDMEKADGGDAQRTRFHKVTESPATLSEMGISKVIKGIGRHYQPIKVRSSVTTAPRGQYQTARFNAFRRIFKETLYRER